MKKPCSRTSTRPTTRSVGQRIPPARATGRIRRPVRRALVDGLRPETGAVLGGQRLEREAEHLGDCRGGVRTDLRDRAGRELARHRRERGSSSPHAVIHW